MNKGNRLRILTLLSALLFLLSLSGCAVRISIAAPTETTVPLTAAEVQALLDRVSVLGHDLDAGTVEATVGILLPEAFLTEMLEASITGTTTDGSPVDLLGEGTLSSEDWFVISDLAQYAELTLELRLLQNQTVIAERTVDLLHFESEG